MAGIETLYVVNHSHTDIGFTDYQGVCFRQHREFVDGALDLVEATADYPDGSRYRWTCEVTGPLLRWLRLASPSSSSASGTGTRPARSTSPGCSTTSRRC